jgi:hypothetical protein
MRELHEACSDKKNTLVKSLIKKYKLVPDSICMEIIATHREKILFPILIQAGGKVNVQCIKNIAETYGNKHFIMQYLDEYEKDHQKEISMYKMKIEKLEKGEPIIDDVIEVKNINDVEEDSPTDKILNIDINMIETCKNKYKYKKNPHNTIVEMFNIQKTKRVNYNDIKALLLNKIHVELWANIEDPNSINIPSRYNKAFGFVEGDKVSVPLKDIEGLIYLFLVNNCE